MRFSPLSAVAGAIVALTAREAIGFVGWLAGSAMRIDWTAEEALLAWWASLEESS